jgi:hypothetical protein
MNLILFCLSIACIPGILICFVFIVFTPNKYFEKSGRDLIEWYEGLSDEERKAVNDKGIYAGWRRKTNVR